MVKQFSQIFLGRIISFFFGGGGGGGREVEVGVDKSPRLSPVAYICFITEVPLEKSTKKHMGPM